MINSEDKDELVSDDISSADNELSEETAADNVPVQEDQTDSDANYEPIIGSYTHDDMFEQLIKEARLRSEQKARIAAEKAAAEDEEIFIAGSGDDESDSAENTAKQEEIGGDDDLDNGSEPEISISVNDSVKKQGSSIAGKIRNAEVLKPEVIKDMFFGSGRSDGDHDIKFTPDGEVSEEEFDDDDIEDPVALDRRTRKRKIADPNREKVIFSIDYMLTPDQALDGYMLFYNEFVKKKNIKLTLVLGLVALIFLFSVIISPKGYLNYMLLLITLSIIAMKWINSESAKKDAIISAEDVKNDSYKLDFYNSRILLKASEFTGDKIYNYPPVMIRFEDIELKVLDYEEIYVLIFKNSYVYTVPKSAMTEEQNKVFGGLLESILGDDYCEFYSRVKEAEEKAERRRQKRAAKERPSDEVTEDHDDLNDLNDLSEFDGGEDPEDE